MIPPLRLSDITLPVPREGARERTLEAIEQFKKADAEIKRLCKEHGFTIPDMICKAQ